MHGNRHRMQDIEHMEVYRSVSRDMADAPSYSIDSSNLMIAKHDPAVA